MDLVLNEIETRIVGVLIEKEMATPDYYPLTLNALVNACNQSTNRHPVMELDKGTVETALARLRTERLVFQVKAQGSRALKYEHNMKAVAEFSDREIAILCVLLLRGPQTAGELRTRTGRLAEFHGLAAVEHVLHKLADHEAGSFVQQLARQPGHKENRFAHLFGGEVPQYEEDALARVVVPVTPTAGGDEDRMDALEQLVDELQSELAELKERFEAFKAQFED